MLRPDLHIYRCPPGLPSAAKGGSGQANPVNANLQMQEQVAHAY